MTSKSLLLELKRTAGLATPEECDALDNMFVISGLGLATPRPAPDAAAWTARYSSEVVEQFMPQPEQAEYTDARPAYAKDADGFIQCAPGDEPGHPDKPRTFRPTDLTQPQPLTLRERYTRDVRGIRRS